MKLCDINIYIVGLLIWGSEGYLEYRARQDGRGERREERGERRDTAGIFMMSLV